MADTVGGASLPRDNGQATAAGDGRGCSSPSALPGRVAAAGPFGETIERFKAGVNADFWIGVTGNFDGYGDWLYRCAFARAARRHWERATGSALSIGHVGVMVLGQEISSPDDFDLSLGQPGIDRVLRTPRTFHWRPRAVQAAPHFDVLYEVQYVARTRFRLGRAGILPAHDLLLLQAQADARLRDWQALYDGFPRSARLLVTDIGLSLWRLLSLTAGFEVSQRDLYCPTEAAELNGYPRRDPADLDAVAGCVTIHNAQGDARGGTKTLPPNVMPAIAAAVNRRGLRAVQVGIRDNRREPPIEGAVDLRGLRIPETARVIKAARLHVDVEGGTAIIAAAVRQGGAGVPPASSSAGRMPAPQAVIFFGSTDPLPFGFEGNVNHTRAICPKPIGPHCFWHNDEWSRRCALGFKHCVNHPQPEAAVRVVLDALDQLEHRQ